MCFRFKIKINLKITKQKNIKIIFVKSGEKIKTFHGYKDLAEKLINIMNRKSILIAIGGGTLGDLAGFVADCFKRN